MKKIKYMRMMGAVVVSICALTFTGCQNIFTNDSKELPDVKEEQDIGAQETLNGKVQYTSIDSVMSITLPNSEWKVVKELDVLHTFASDYGEIQISHVVGADAKKVPELYNEDDMLEYLQKKLREQEAPEVETENEEQEESEEENQEDNETIFEIEDFQCNILKSVNFYQYKLKYQSVSNKAYDIVYGIQSETEIYEIKATLYEMDQELLQELEEAIDSFILIKDKELEESLTKARQYTKSTTDGSIKADGLELIKTSDSTQDGKDSKIYTCVSSANVRDKAGMSSSILGAIETGEEVKVLSEEGGWYEIEFEGGTGFVYKDYLEP